MWFRGGVCPRGGRRGTVAPVAPQFSVHAHQALAGLLPTKSWTGIAYRDQVISPVTTEEVYFSTPVETRRGAASGGGGLGPLPS
jgi:hypothetical protein